MQVAFDAAAFEVGGVQDAGAALGEVLDAPLEFAGPVRAEEGGRGDGVQAGQAAAAQGAAISSSPPRTVIPSYWVWRANDSSMGSAQDQA